MQSQIPDDTSKWYEWKLIDPIKFIYGRSQLCLAAQGIYESYSSITSLRSWMTTFMFRDITDEGFDIIHNKDDGNCLYWAMLCCLCQHQLVNYEADLSSSKKAHSKMLETRKSLHKWWMDQKEELQCAFERGDYTDFQEKAQTTTRDALLSAFAKEEFEEIGKFICTKKMDKEDFDFKNDCPSNACAFALFALFALGWKKNVMVFFAMQMETMKRGYYYSTMKCTIQDERLIVKCSPNINYDPKIVDDDMNYFLWMAKKVSDDCEMLGTKEKVISRAMCLVRNPNEKKSRPKEINLLISSPRGRTKIKKCRTRDQVLIVRCEFAQDELGIGDTTFTHQWRYLDVVLEDQCFLSDYGLEDGDTVHLEKVYIY